MSDPRERGRRRAAARQAQAQDVFARQLTKNVDIEQLLLDKLIQRTRGGAGGILQQFKKLDTSSGDGAEISFDQFKQCLEKFGLQGIRDDDVRVLFHKYDADGSGTISFKEFTDQVAVSFSRAMKVGGSSTDIQDAKRAREKARILKQQALRTSWKTVSVDAERLLLEKIEQRIGGGGNSLRLAFRRFDNGKGDSSINFIEFQEAMRRLGLQGVAQDDAMRLFHKFDGDGNGTIDFSEFTEFVMKSSAEQTSISLDTSTASREAARLRRKALDKQKSCSALHWKYAEKNIDVEQLLIDKVMQKLAGGQDALRRAFCLFDKDLGDAAEIDQETFRLGMESLGLVDVPPRLCKRIFKRFDASGDGKIDFDEFVARVDRNASPLTLDNEPRAPTSSKTGCCKHCCCHKSPSGKRHHQHHPLHNSAKLSSRSGKSSRSSRSSRSSSSNGTHRSSARRTEETLLPMVTGRSLIE